MYRAYRWLFGFTSKKLSKDGAIILIVLFNLLMLAACTRERPVPVSVVAGTDGEPEVVVNPSAPQPNLEPDVQRIPNNNEPDVQEVVPGPTPTIRSVDELPVPSLMQYTVQSGDTIFSISEKLETDPLTIRQLNYLLDDNIFVGQIIDVPYIEGTTEDGQPTPEPEPYVYTVQPNDTLSDLAVRFDVNIVELIAANQAIDPNQLILGQEVLIPGYRPLIPQESTDRGNDGQQNGERVPAVFHVVQQGEGLNEIADKYGVNAGVIAEANNIANRNLLRAGQELVIPGVTSRQAALARGGTVHIVQLGESLSSIAQSYGISAETIVTLNSIENQNNIYVGQELIVPRR